MRQRITWELFNQKRVMLWVDTEESYHAPAFPYNGPYRYPVRSGVRLQISGKNVKLGIG